MTIKELRKELGLTLADFAKSIEAGLSTISAYESGKRKPSDNVLAKIKEVHGVDLTAEAAPAPKAEKKAAAPKAEKKAAAPKTEKKAAAPKAEKKAAAPKAEKKAAAPKAEKAAPAAKQPAEKKPAGRKPAKKAEPQIIVQSPLGGEITPFAILAKVGDVDKVYIRVDLNKAFWVKGDKTGSVDLW